MSLAFTDSLRHDGHRKFDGGGVFDACAFGPSGIIRLDCNVTGGFIVFPWVIGRYGNRENQDARVATHLNELNRGGNRRAVCGSRFTCMPTLSKIIMSHLRRSTRLEQAFEFICFDTRFIEGLGDVELRVQNMIPPLKRFPHHLRLKVQPFIHVSSPVVAT